MTRRGRLFRRGRRATAMHLLARVGLLHDFTREEGVEYPVEEAYLNVPAMIDFEHAKAKR